MRMPQRLRGTAGAACAGARDGAASSSARRRRRNGGDHGAGTRSHTPVCLRTGARGTSCHVIRHTGRRCFRADRSPLSPFPPNFAGRPLEGAAAPPHAPSRLARSEMSSCGVCACWAAPKRPLRAMVAQPATCHVAGTCGTCDAGGRAMSARCSRARVSQRRQRLRCQGLAGSVCSWWARAFGACEQPAPRAGSGSLLTAAFLAVHCRPSLLLHACKRVERASGSTHMQPGQWRVFLHSLCACRGGQRRRQRCFCRASPG